MLRIKRTTTPTFNLLEDMFDNMFQNSNIYNNVLIDPFGPQYPKWFTKTNVTDLTNVGRYPIHCTTDPKDNSVKINFDVPGCQKEELEIVYDEATKLLAVTLIPGAKTSVGDYRTFKYSYYLDGYDIDTLDATCEKGILTVTAKSLKPIIPPKQTKRTIEIK